MFHWDNQNIEMIFHLSASKIFKASVYKEKDILKVKNLRLV